MAGENTDAPDRPFIKIIVQRRYRLTCELTSVGAANFIRCIHCNDIAEAVFSLKCKHNLCGECFFRCIPYTCVKDGISTEKGLHRRPILRVIEGLTTTVVQCPECSDNFVYEEFKRHMDNSHIGFRDVIGVRPYQEEQKKCGEVPETPTEPASRENEPQGDGTDGGCTKFPQCQDLCDKKDLQKASADSAVESTEEGDIKMLKITLQQLEKRVEALELPLRRLIERLRKDV
ncbi:uncharacterized protein LOC144141589 isoform X2 [Haemaphysalis longicornis]